MWHPINTIPKDGKEYAIVQMYKGAATLECGGITSIFYVDDKDARDMEPYWSGGDVLEVDEIYTRYTHWTELPKD